MKQLTRIVSGFSSALLLATPAILVPAAGYTQQLDEIVVTARKMTENLQEVPLAITAIGSEEIDRLGVKDLADLSQQDTSVQFDEGFNPSDTRITIRGLSPTRGRPNAATLIDGIDITSEAVSNAGGSLLIDPRLIDVERIEIVKGPQSALYGRSAFAGAIQYVTKDPDDVLGGEVFVEGNHEGESQLRGNVSIPINDTLGVRFNGLAFNNRGFYRNSATGDYVGGGEGLGGTMTVVFEPVDEMKFKWRTDYSENKFDPPAQATLNDLNTVYDLGNTGGLAPSVSNIAPLTSNCTGGFLDNYGCGETQIIKQLFDDPSYDPVYEAYGAPGAGIYDPTDDEARNIFNKQVISIFTGTVPDAGDVQVALSPDYRKVPNGKEGRAKDFSGTELTVFRTSLVFDWAISDSVELTSYSSYTDATDEFEGDLGKWYVDDCSTTAGPGEDPRFAGLDCGPGMSDGISDLNAMFAQDTVNDTTQVSQEFRVAWDINDAVRFTTGINYWRERVKEDALNLTLFTGGANCNLLPSEVTPGAFVDASLDPRGQSFSGFFPERDLCGVTASPVAYWANDVFMARLSQPSELVREVDHYSWYGNVEWNFTDNFKTTLEWRFAKEDNSVIGPAQAPCLDFDDAVFEADGSVGCGDGATTAQEIITGPSAVFPCGLNGRCDGLGMGFGDSWWDYGLLPQQGLINSVSRSDRTWAPKVTFEYLIGYDINTYFSWSRGIKPGGFSLLTSGAFGLDANNDGNYDEIAFEPERLDVWELGAKTELFNGRVRLNGSVYYQDFKDKQVSVQEVVSNTIGTAVKNIDGSEIYGMELEGTWQTTDNLRMQMGYTYTDSEYTDYTVLSRSANDIARIELGNGQGCLELTTFPNGDPACLASYNGNELERAPKHAFLLNANYSNNLFDTGNEWYAEGNFRYQSSRWLEQYNITKFPSYTRTNISVGLIADKWDLQIYVNNLLDDDTPIAGGANPGLVTGSFGLGFCGCVPPGVPGAGFPGVNAGPILDSDIYINMPDPRVIGARIKFLFGG